MNMIYMHNCNSNFFSHLKILEKGKVMTNEPLCAAPISNLPFLVVVCRILQPRQRGTRMRGEQHTPKGMIERLSGYLPQFLESSIYLIKELTKLRTP